MLISIASIADAAIRVLHINEEKTMNLNQVYNKKY